MSTTLVPQAGSGCFLRCPFAPEIELSLHEGLDELEPAAWDALVAHRGLYLQRRFLEPLDRGCEEVRYAAFRKEHRLLGVARFERARFTGPSVLPLLGEGEWARWAARSVGLDKPVQTWAWICGSAFFGCEHGFAFSDELDRGEALQLLRRALSELQRDAPAPNLLFKEFLGEAPLPLSELGCAEMQGGHRMVLELDPAWGSYDDYLASLRSKFRVKARRADSMSAALHVRELELAELWVHQERVQELLDQVCAKADYQLGCVSVASITALRARLGPELHLRGYFLDGRLVGFLSAFERGDTLDAHLVGLDYSVARQHGIYPRMLVDFLRIGLERGLERIDYGRAAEDIKSTLGARPVPTTVFLRHRNALVNPVLGLVARSVRLDEPKLRAPFKA